MRLFAAVPALLAIAAAPAPHNTVEEKTEVYAFDYSFPDEVDRFPALKRWFVAERSAVRTKLIANAQEEYRESKKESYPWNPRSAGQTWKVVTETPRFLSLSGEVYAYTGGAHGLFGTDALLWDKAAGVRRAPEDLFVSARALQAAVGDALCRALDRERAKKRGEPVKRGEWPNQCVAVSETTLLLGASDRRHFDRVGLLADPYVAGPWAEGPYEVTLPVTPALIAAVKPAYRSAFAVR